MIRGALGGAWAGGGSARVAGVALVALLLLAFTLGGSSRADTPYLLTLRPAAVLALGLALACVTRRDLAGQWPPALLALGAVLLPALHLLPLPPGVWRSLPGRELIAEIDAAAGLGEVWRPLTMTPPETLNALLAGVLPLAVILLAARIEPAARARLVLLALAFGALSGLIGLLQVLGDPRSPLYLHDITNNGSAVGLFANRNHQGVLLACMIPLAFAAASIPWGDSGGAGGGRRLYRRGITPEWRMPAAIAGACLLVPLILVTGSRAGLLMALVGLASVPLIVPRRAAGPAGRRALTRRAWLGVAGAAVAALTLAAVWLGRDQALERLLGSTPEEDLRVQMLPTLWELLTLHLTWGSGLGSFERLYQVYEPASLLMPNYVNHAHNDWLEVALAGGLPALALVAAGLAALALRAPVALWGEGDAWRPLRRASLACVAILGLASISDYPLRTPAGVAVFALCAAWLYLPHPGAGRGAGGGFEMSRELP